MPLINIKNKYLFRTYTIHIVSCVAFLFLPLIASPRASFFDGFAFGPPEIQGIISAFLLIVFFYFNYLVFLPKLLYKRRYVSWFAVVLVSFILIVLIPNSLFGNRFEKPRKFDSHQEFRPDKRPDAKPNMGPPDNRHEDGKEDRADFQRPHHHDNDGKLHDFFRTFQIEESLLKFLFVLALSFLLKTNRFWKESREEKRKAELLFLKSQVNPHFLFNTLNGIYALSLEKSEETSKAIVKLSELMRYVVSEIEKEDVLLSDEVKYLENYVDLQQLRFGETVKINFYVSGLNPEARISPLLFINFVENAFKYGIDTKIISEIYIELKSVNGDLYFSVKNQHNNKNTDSTQLQKGLENVTRRLELIYPNQHSLKVNNTGSEYFIELIIKNIQ